MRGFGVDVLENSSKNSTVLDYYAEIIKGKLSGVGSSIVMDHIYDVMYGMVPSTEAGLLPLQQVTMHAKEKWGPNDPMSKAIKDFRLYDIAKVYGYNFTEWMDVPFDTAQKIIKVMKEAKRKEHETMNQIQNDFG